MQSGDKPLTIDINQTLNIISILQFSFLSCSWLPLGVQVPNHEGILTDHQRVLDRMTRDMEAEHLASLLTPHTHD